MNWKAWVSAFLLVFAAPAAADPPAPGNILLREIPYPLRVLDLPSGMRILVEEDHTQPLVAVVAVVDSGGSADPAGKEGLAHLVEHLAFRARQDGKRQMSSLLDFAGVGTWNASTSHDLTLYYSVGPKESLPALLTLEGARMLHPLLGVDAKTFDVEREVVRNELNQRDESGQVAAVWTKLYAALYPVGHPYARPVIGSDASISALTLADAEAFVREHYVPSKITLLIAGDVDAQNIGKTLDQNFPAQFLDPPASGKVSASARLSPTPRAVPEPPERKPLTTLHVPADGPTLYIAWAMPRGYDGDGYIQSFLANAVGQEAGGAFATESDIVGLSAVVIRGREASTFLVVARLGEGKNPGQSAERVIDQLVRIWEPSPNGLADSVNRERERRFTRLRGGALVRTAVAGESLSSRAQTRAEYFHVTGDPRTLSRDLTGIAQLNSTRFESYSYRWLKRDNARIVFVQPSGIPRADIDASGRALVFTPPEENKFVVPAGALQTFVHPPAVDLQSFKLKNGLEVVLVRRQRAPTVSVTLAVRGGSSTVDPLGVPVYVEYFARPHLPKFGTPADFGASSRTWTEADSTYTRLTGASGNLENLLDILSKSVDTLHVDESISIAFKLYIRPSLVAYEQLYSERAEREFLRTVYPGSPYARTPLTADLDKLSTGDAHGWIGRAIRPGNSVLVVSGDIEFEPARRMVTDWLGGWSGKAEQSEVSLTTLQKGPGTQVFRLDRPGAKQVELRMGCALQSDQPKDLMAFRLVGERMRRRMGDFARGMLGGSYGFRGGADWNRGASHIEVTGSVDDRVVTRAVALARKELDELAQLQVGDEELGRLQWRLGMASNVAYQRNDALGAHLAWVRLANLPLDFAVKYPELLASVTAADVNRVAAACAGTATLGLVGDPGVTGAALKSTAR